jgi:DNA invertase Pin-like site-specific DNA recombinase
MSGLLIGYARVSTDAQDLTAQRDALAALGVPPDRLYIDHGLTGTHRDRPGRREALAACRGAARKNFSTRLTEVDRRDSAAPRGR